MVKYNGLESRARLVWARGSNPLSSAKEYEGKVVGKVDVDNNQDFAGKYGIRNIPTVLVFKDGEVVGRQVGVAPKKTYTDALDSLL